tara:strand:- start:91 stop:972 length:882 start_codon:yes stop_codon:yes gene_type:complete
MAIPALTVELAILWEMDASRIGWPGGIYFAGYAVALPFPTGAANRMDGRIVYVVAALISAATSFSVALFVEGFWWALVLRFAAGAGFAGIHIVGMKLLVDRLTGDAQTRASAFYTVAFAIGSGCSFLAAGILSNLFGWKAVFFFGWRRVANVIADTALDWPFDFWQRNTVEPIVSRFPSSAPRFGDRSLCYRLRRKPLGSFRGSCLVRSIPGFQFSGDRGFRFGLGSDHCRGVVRIYRGAVEPCFCGTRSSMGSKTCHLCGFASVRVGLQHAWLAGFRSLCTRSCPAIGSRHH